MIGSIDDNIFSDGMMVRIVKISCDETCPLEEEIIIDRNAAAGGCGGGDIIPTHLQTTHVKTCNDGSADVVIDTTPLIRMTYPTNDSQKEAALSSLAGLYAYSISSTSKMDNSTIPNIRATRLSMACGCHAQRFVGDIWVGKLGYTFQENGGYILRNLDLSISDIEYASEYSPDLRTSIVGSIMMQHKNENVGSVSEWLGNAQQKKYHDGEVMNALAIAMTRADVVCDEGESSDNDDSSSDGPSSSTSSVYDKKNERTDHNQTVITETTLCLHCRGPAATLCTNCGGAYFCTEPRKCSTNGWSHKCLCSTWKIYVQRRSQLSKFPYLSGWQVPILKEQCFTSEKTYQDFLINLGVITPATNTTSGENHTQQNWWATELHGWSGGNSQSSKDVNPVHRVSYIEGFALKDRTLIPEERHITIDDIDHANTTYNEDTGASRDSAKLIQTDEHGLPILSSWEHYYRLRSLPPSSPIGLLATFPLTIYYTIQRYGTVPLTVAQMLEKSLRIHVVGVEKELNFVDLFKELGYLMPKNIEIEMTWIVRDDMFPENRNEKNLSLQLTENLKLAILGGTYGQSLNPDFDIVGGPPDMIIGMNAGLFAYESWRHVISYLNHHKNIVGVFTDYNEHSGMNCAALGGWNSTNSLEVNPFRQMRAMPVYSFNLPQFSNGFVYVFNEQELE